jgi:hypothetical protein
MSGKSYIGRQFLGYISLDKFKVGTEKLEDEIKLLDMKLPPEEILCFEHRFVGKSVKFLLPKFPHLECYYVECDDDTYIERVYKRCADGKLLAKKYPGGPPQEYLDDVLLKHHVKIDKFKRGYYDQKYGVIFKPVSELYAKAN